MTTDIRTYVPGPSEALPQKDLTPTRSARSALVQWVTQPAGTWTALAVCAVAVGVRLLVARMSHGTNDIDTWQRFAQFVSYFGVLRVYELDRWFNHPPIMGWYAVLAMKLSSAFSANFDWVFKLVPMLASVITVWLVHRLGRLNVLWLLLFALNPTDLLISAYHGNTDPICVAFCVASVWFANRNKPWLSGFALGAALNVKLIPVVLVAPLALSLKPRQMLRFLIALGLCALPFVPIWLGPWQAFKQNAILYNSFRSPWGVGLIAAALDGRLITYSGLVSELALSIGKPLILSASVLLGVLQFRFGWFSRAELCTLAFGCFLAFAPGFGVQYLLYPTAFFAVIPGSRRGFQYIYLSGVFAWAIYYGFWTGTVPAFSNFNRPFDLRMVLTGFVTWAWLMRYLAQTAARPIVSSKEWRMLTSAF